MTTENENGELRQLLEIKRAYRRNLTSLEKEVKAKYERELAEGKKHVKEVYLESVVDVVFADPGPAEVTVEAKEATVTVIPQVEVKTEVVPKPAPAPATNCPECGNTVDANDKFCSQCACPLTDVVEKEANMGDWPVVSASRKLKPRRR
jgi:hypothetical protein